MGCSLDASVREASTEADKVILGAFTLRGSSAVAVAFFPVLDVGLVLRVRLTLGLQVVSDRVCVAGRVETEEVQGVAPVPTV